MSTRWQIAPPCPSDFLASIANVSPIVGQVLWNRGCKTKDEVEDFLEPSFEKHVHAPSQFQHMARVIERIFRAIETGERITIHGDYDADGITGTTVLMTTLREVEARWREAMGLPSYVLENGESGSRIDFYIPHRDKEGYGLRHETVTK
jgi:single-stranded-DNA-specific exonuclease